MLSRDLGADRRCRTIHAEDRGGIESGHSDGDDSSTTVDVTADDGGDVGDVDISSGDSKEESESSNAEEENGDTDEADKDGEQEENTEKESSEK